jgi:L-ascorbate metabolism protein UlaG (beta-lactamase superfamily)
LAKIPAAGRGRDRSVTMITYIGHATVLVEMEGTRLLTDPLLRRRVVHLRRGVGLDLPSLGEVDAVLLSHAHYDHLDLPSLARLGRRTRRIAPLGIGGLLRRRGFERVEEVEVGGRVTVGSVKVTATAAAHDGRRPLHSDSGPALGFLIEGSRQIYFAGDTDIFDEMESLAGDIDLAFLPVWGWGRKLGRGQHLGPEEAAAALTLLRPRMAVPIHWGTYLPAHRRVSAATAFFSDPPRTFVRAAAALAPEVDVRVLAPGESLSVPSSRVAEAGTRLGARSP